MRAMILLVTLVGQCAIHGGCALVAGGLAGAAGHAYVEGADVRAYHHPVRTSAQACAVALHRMGIKPKKTQIDDFGGVITAETADGDHIKVRVDPDGTGSVVTVRFGAFGDKKKSDALFARLEETLPNEQTQTSVSKLPSTDAQIVPAAPGAIVIPGESSFEPNAPIPSVPNP